MFGVWCLYCPATSQRTASGLQVGDEGAGHFVKMVHNGIEYGDMQLICEAYHLMKDVLEMNHDEMAQVSHLMSPCRCLDFILHTLLIIWMI